MRFLQEQLAFLKAQMDAMMQAGAASEQNIQIHSCVFEIAKFFFIMSTT